MHDAEPQFGANKPDIRPTMVFSALLSLLVLIILLLDYAEHPREFGKSWSYGKGTSIFEVGYTVALTASAFAGALFRKTWIGCLNATLMSGVSVYCIVNGLSTLNDKSIMGGRGPDANPVAGVVYGAAIGVIVFGIACGIFTFALWAKALRSAPNKPVYPLQR